MDRILLNDGTLGDMLGIGKRTVARLSAAGKIPKPVRIGGSVRWDRHVIEDWIRQGCPDRAEFEATQKSGVQNA